VKEDRARITLQSARFCQPILRRLAPTRVIACSDDYHVPRCRWLLRLAGFASEPLAARPEQRRIGTLLHELLAFPRDTLCWFLGI
jgi:uncharacterized SAM-binding protein YcdF (DUF218 family)